MLNDPMRVRPVYLQLPRHPLLRILVFAGGALALVALAAMGLLVGTLTLAVAAGYMLVRRWLGGRNRVRTDPSIIEGEFSVVQDRPRGALPPGD
ncbi:MAG TPA: hypothetical protein VJ862_11235 [Rhodanobacteraceae bacterium]|nr:hypothetical protein [Rhodanobacteraceae bacterium]